MVTDNSVLHTTFPDRQRGQVFEFYVVVWQAIRRDSTPAVRFRHERRLCRSPARRTRPARGGALRLAAGRYVALVAVRTELRGGSHVTLCPKSTNGSQRAFVT